MNTLRVLLFAACYHPLKHRYPRMFDSAWNREQILLALKDTT